MEKHGKTVKDEDCNYSKHQADRLNNMFYGDDRIDEMMDENDQDMLLNDEGDDDLLMQGEIEDDMANVLPQKQGMQ